MNNDQYWGTEDELAHIRNLGTYCESSIKTPRLTWLERYRGTMNLKAEWGTMDRAAVERYVKVEIRKERQRASRKAA